MSKCSAIFSGEHNLTMRTRPRPSAIGANQCGLVGFEGGRRKLSKAKSVVFEMLNFFCLLSWIRALVGVLAGIQVGGVSTLALLFDCLGVSIP